MPQTSPLESCLSLPQVGTSEWVAERRAEPDSDALWLWVAPERDEFRGFTVGAPEDPEFQDLLAGIFESPAEGSAGRPGHVIVADEALVSPVQALLSPLGIQVSQRALKPPEMDLLNAVRPVVMQQLMLDAAMPQEHDEDQFERLLDAIERVLELDPWPRLPRHACFMLEGFGADPMAVLMGFEHGVRALGVLTLKDLDVATAPTPGTFEREGVWLQFEQDTIMGHQRLWAHMGQANDQPLESREQVNCLLAALEVVVKSTAHGKRPPEEQSFELSDWVDSPCTIGVLFLAEDPAPARRRPTATHRSSKHGSPKGPRRH